MTTTATLSLFDLFRKFESLNHKAILETLAKGAPDMFLQAVSNTVEFESAPAWMLQVIEFLNANQKVLAIKECRSATGMGLKESKDTIDMLCHGEGCPGSANEDSINFYKKFVQMGFTVAGCVKPHVDQPLLQVFCARFNDGSIYGIFKQRRLAQAVVDRKAAEFVSNHYVD